MCPVTVRTHRGSGNEIISRTQRPIASTSSEIATWSQTVTKPRVEGGAESSTESAVEVRGVSKDDSGGVESSAGSAVEGRGVNEVGSGESDRQRGRQWRAEASTRSAVESRIVSEGGYGGRNQ